MLQGKSRNFVLLQYHFREGREGGVVLTYYWQDVEDGKAGSVGILWS